MKEIKFTEYDLSNGLHVILCVDRIAPVVAVDVWYHVGSKNESETRTGFAHLFEHMMFQGSANVGKAEHMSYIERAGGTFNGSTTWDRTNYFETVLSNRLGLALWLESDRMASLDVSQINLDNQRQVVKEERRWRVDNRPYGTAWEKIFSLAYKQHPYRWPVVGYMKDLDASSVDDVRSFFKKFYSPSNATLVLAGDFKPSDARRAIDRYFSDIPAGEKIGRPEVADPPLGCEMREDVPDSVSLPAIYIAFRIPELTHADAIPLDLVAHILSHGDSSRLYHDMVYEKQIADSVDAYSVEMEDPGLFIINAVAALNHSVNELEDAISNQLNKLASHAPDEREVRKAKNQSLSKWASGLSRSMGRADHLAHYSVFHHSAARINSYPADVEAITPARIREVAERYLSTDHRVVVNYLPGAKQGLN